MRDREGTLLDSIPAAELGVIRHRVYQGVALGRQGVSAVLSMV
jgi:hypothetical protein